MTIGLSTAIGERPHRVTLQNPGPAVPDSDGGFTQSWTDLTPPALSVAIVPATAQTLERLAAGTVVATATHVVTGPYHSGVRIGTRLLYSGRTFSVLGLANVDERSATMVLVCAELLA